MQRRQSAYTAPNSIASIPAKSNVEAEEACGLATELKIKQILLGFDLGNICMNNFCPIPKPLNVTTVQGVLFLHGPPQERKEGRGGLTE